MTLANNDINNNHLDSESKDAANNSNVIEKSQSLNSDPLLENGFQIDKQEGIDNHLSYNALINNELLGIIIVDGHYKVHAYNALAQEIMTAVCDVILVPKKSLLVCGQNEIANDWTMLLKKVSEVGSIKQKVNWTDLTRKERQIIIHISVIPGNEASIAGYLIYLQDESSNLALQKKISESDERFESVLSNITDIITVVDEKGFILYESPSVEKVLGYRQEQLIGTNITNLLHPDDLERVLGIFAQGLRESGKGPMVRYRFRKADGSYINMESQGNNQVDNPAIRGVVVSSRDITQQLESEEQLKKSFFRTRQSFEYIPIGYVTHRFDGSVIELNATAYDIFGFDRLKAPEEFNIKREIFSNSQNYNEWMELLKLSKRLIEQKIIIRNTSGEALIVNVNLSLIESENGEEIVQGIFSDVTNDQSSKRLIDHTLKLYEHVDLNTSEELLIKGVDLAESLLSSEMAFLHEMDNSGKKVKKTYWSSRTVQMVTHPEILNSYPLKNAGVWLECLKTLKPVLYNNYAAESDKKGMPDGYEAVERLLAVPLIESDRIKAIAVVANKKFVYNTLDKEQLSAFVKVWWANVERKRQLEQANFNQQLLALSQKLAKLGTWNYDLRSGKLTWTDELYNIFELDKDQFGETHPAFINRINEEDRDRVLSITTQAQKDGKPFEVTYHINTPSGEEKVIQEYGYAEKDGKGIVVRLYGIATDVTRQYFEKIRQEILGQVSILINKHVLITDALQSVLEYLTTFGKFDFGESWMVTEDKKSLKKIADFAFTEKGNVFKQASNYLAELDLGEGLPGLVLSSKKITILENLVEPTFKRGAIAAQAGLKTALGVPILHENDINGVLVFGSSKGKKAFTHLEIILNEIIGFLGTEIKRKILQDELNQWFNTLPDIIAIAGNDGYFKRINPAASSILGYTNEELLATPWLNLVHPNDRNATISEFENLSNVRNGYNFQNRYISKSGKIVWLDWTTVPNEEREIMFAVAKDITHQKNLQELLNDVAKLARISGWEQDFVNKTVFVSQNLKDLYGSEFSLGPTPADFVNLFHEEDQNQIQQQIKEALHYGKEVDFEARLITNSGKNNWVRVVGKAEFVRGKCTRLYGSVQDIHHKKQTELELKKSYQALADYKKALDQSANLILTDEEGYIIEVNDHTCKLSGYTRYELIGQHTRINKSGDHSEDFYEEMWRDISSGKIWRGDLHNKRKDGSSYWVDTIIVPMKNEHGIIHQYLAIRNDITEKRKHLEAIQLQNEKLREIAWTQSHIVRAPLARLLGLIQLTSEDHCQSLEDLMKYRDLIKISAEELDEVVRKIVDTAGQIELK